MEELADKDNSPLKDSEIARLIDVSNSAGYKKQEAIPERNLIDFKPKSLLEIALKEDNKEKKIDAQPDSNVNQDEKVEESQISETEISESAKAPENQNLELHWKIKLCNNIVKVLTLVSIIFHMNIFSLLLSSCT